jgi:hypothetical protein
MSDRGGDNSRCILLINKPDDQDEVDRLMNLCDIIARLRIDLEYEEYCLEILRAMEGGAPKEALQGAGVDPVDAQEGQV